MVSRDETNFNRLLRRCETMASESNFSDWRLEKYVGTLLEYLAKLRTLSANKPSPETLTEYTRKVELLKGLLEAEKKVSATDRAIAADFLASGNSNAGSDGLSPSKEIHLHTRARYHKDLRDDLLGKSADTETENGVVRHRKGVTETGDNEDIDTVIRHHHELQEKIAEEMLYLTRNMKDHATAASHVIKEDNKNLTDSSRLADSNYSKLKVEGERLETHVKKSCNWWIWIMLGLVCCTFIWMVLFMKVYPKR